MLVSPRELVGFKVQRPIGQDTWNGNAVEAPRVSTEVWKIYLGVWYMYRAFKPKIFCILQLLLHTGEGSDSCHSPPSTDKVIPLRFINLTVLRKGHIFVKACQNGRAISKSLISPLQPSLETNLQSGHKPWKWIVTMTFHWHSMWFHVIWLKDLWWICAELLTTLQSMQQVCGPAAV